MIGTSSASVSLGGGQGSSRGQWVTEQTAFLARNKLDAYVENHTQIDGAVLNSASGDLKLDTGTLGFSDLTDYDKATQMSGQVGLTTPGAGGKMPGVTLQGSYASHDTEQKTRATLGEGEIVIRDEKKQQEIEKDGQDAGARIDQPRRDEGAGDHQGRTGGGQGLCVDRGYQGDRNYLGKNASSAGDPRRYIRRARSDANE